MAQTTYEVWVAGVVPEQDLQDLGAVTVATERASTVLYGDIADEAALFGLLARLRALGLEVFAIVDDRIAAMSPDQITGIENRADALYFTVTIVSTVGFGDILATESAARRLATAQLLINLSFVGPRCGCSATFMTRRTSPRPPTHSRRSPSGSPGRPTSSPLSERVVVVPASPGGTSPGAGSSPSSHARQIASLPRAAPGSVGLGPPSSPDRGAARAPQDLPGGGASEAGAEQWLPGGCPTRQRHRVHRLAHESPELDNEPWLSPRPTDDGRVTRRSPL